MSRSRVLRYRDGGWEGVEPRRYDESGPTGLQVARHTLLGGPDEDPALSFETRYFEVAPGATSSLERHAHPHVVVILQGRGEVRLGDSSATVAPFDVVFVAPWEVHRFQAAAGEPLGFLCVVDRERDRPRRLGEP